MNLELPRYDWLRRGLRTFFQAFITLFGFLMTPLLQEVINAVKDGRAVVLDFNAIESIVIASVAAGGIALLAFVQNALEDKVPGMPAPLKGVPSAGQDPVPDPMQAEIDRAINAPRSSWATERRNPPTV